jgi:hypothetical protein
MAATLATNSTPSTSSSSSLTQHHKATTSTNRLIIKNDNTRNDMNNNSTLDIRQHTNDAASKHKFLIKFDLGDLVWVKLSNHPWWPCVITNDNTVPNNCFFKVLDNTSIYYYVELFGYSKERAWASANDMFAFDGIESFKKYAQNQVDLAPTKQDKEKLAERFQLKVSMSKRKQWDNAVELADKHANKLKSLKRKREQTDDICDDQLTNAIKKQQASQLTTRINFGSNTQLNNDENDENDLSDEDDDEDDDDDDEESMQPTSIYEYDQPAVQFSHKNHSDEEYEDDRDRTNQRDNFQIKSESSFVKSAEFSQGSSQRKEKQYDVESMSKNAKKEKEILKENLKTSKSNPMSAKNASNFKCEPIEQQNNKPISLKIKPLPLNSETGEKRAHQSKKSGKSQTTKRSSTSSESSSSSSSLPSSSSSSACSSSSASSSDSSSCESSNEEEDIARRKEPQSLKQIKSYNYPQSIDEMISKKKVKSEGKASKSTMQLITTTSSTTNYGNSAMSSNTSSTNKSKKNKSGVQRKRNSNKSTSDSQMMMQHGSKNSHMTNILIQNNINNMIGQNASGSGTTETYLIDRYKYAVRHIKQGLSIEEACNKYRISKGALLKCLSGGTAPRGKKTRLSESEENEIVEWLINDRDLKYNDAIHLVFEKVVHIFKQAQRPNPFNNGRPSMDWWYDFLSRHPQIMASKPDWLMRGKVNDQYIKDVQSGQLKCTKFRRALLSAIQYIKSMNDNKSTIAPLLTSSSSSSPSSSSSAASSSLMNNYNSNESKASSLHKSTIHSNSSKSSPGLATHQGKAINRNNHTRQQIQSSSSTILSSDKKKRRLTMNSLSSSIAPESSSVSSQLIGQPQQQLYSQLNSNLNHSHNAMIKQIKPLHFDANSSDRYKQEKMDAGEMLDKTSDELDCTTANLFDNDEFFTSTKGDEALLSTTDLIDANFNPSGHHHQEDENESSFDNEFLNAALSDNNSNNNNGANHFDDIIDPIDHHTILNSAKHHMHDSNPSAFNLNKYANDMNCLKLNNNMNSIHHGNQQSNHLSQQQQQLQQQQQQLQFQQQNKLGHHSHFYQHHAESNGHMSHLIVTDINEDENGHEQVNHNNQGDDYQNDIENHHHHQHNHHNSHSHYHHQPHSNVNPMPARLLNNSLTANLDEEDEEYMRNTIDPSAFLP